MKRRIRRTRQLVPTKFATGVRRGGPDITSSEPDGRRPVFVSWWMWLGRCYRVRETDLSVDAYVVSASRS